MCGRYTLHVQKQPLAEAIALALPEAYAPDYNIGPGQEALSLATRDRLQTVATMMRWGLRTPQNFHINARIETADTTPRFRESWHEHRCLLPANGFYEWYQDGITKQPYFLYPREEPLLYFAGLWFPSPESGEPPAFVILTTEAQACVREIHERMPVMLKAEEARGAWLSGELDKREAQAMAQAIPLEKHTVSRRVNSVQNKDSRLIEATSPLTDDQMMLF
jgi:putative SOS response-associated peptidase YedK